MVIRLAGDVVLNATGSVPRRWGLLWPRASCMHDPLPRMAHDAPLVKRTLDYRADAEVATGLDGAVRSRLEQRPVGTSVNNSAASRLELRAYSTSATALATFASVWSQSTAGALHAHDERAWQHQLCAMKRAQCLRSPLPARAATGLDCLRRLRTAPRGRGGCSIVVAGQSHVRNTTRLDAASAHGETAWREAVLNQPHVAHSLSPAAGEGRDGGGRLR